MLRRLNREDGVTIVQVTHNEEYARMGDRVVELLDGRVEKSYVTTQAP
jgi:ABC-type lipoprotein export system ATPase subunit